MNKRFMVMIWVFFLCSMIFGAGCSRFWSRGPGSKEYKDTFQLRSGDRVVFLGDSLTAARAYTEIVERYTVSAYPDRKIRFFNAGVGGDTAERALLRLQQTVLAHRPTVVTIVLGVNDILWGMQADEAHKKAYYDNMATIIKECQKAGARVYVLGPAPTKLGAELKDPEAERPHPLKEMSDQVRAMAEDMGARTIDLYDEFRDVQWTIRKAYLSRPKEQPGQKAQEEPQTHIGDGVHLADLGNQALAYILLKGLGAPDAVSALEIDAAQPAITDAYRCEVSGLSKEGKTLRFVRKDEGWPLHLGVFAWVNFAYVPTGEKLSGYHLKVKGLTGSEYYQIRVNGQALTTTTATQLGQGLNLAYTTPEPFAMFPPWKAQAMEVEQLTKAMGELDSSRSMGAHLAPQEKFFSKKLQYRTDMEMDHLWDLRNYLAEPRALHFEIIPTAAPQPKAKPDPAALRKYIEAVKKAEEQKKKEAGQYKTK